ncbi:hypothetical protein KR215_008323, partial [Drosophila sulfurigaster]
QFLFVTVFISLLCVLSAQAADWTDICAFEDDGTRLPLPLDCKRYVLCSDREIAAIRSCPRGLHFNNKLGECDFQWRADCSGLSLYANADSDEDCVCSCCADECQANSTSRPTTDSTTSRPTTDSTTSSTGSTSRPTTDSTTSRPTTDSTTPSGSSTSSPIVPSYCSDKRPNCANELDGARVPIDGVCTSYLQCSHGCSYEQPCPSGLYFDPDTEMCDYFWNVDCVPNDTEDATGGEIAGPSGTTCTDQSVCAGQRDGRMFANNETNGYFVCQCQCPIAMPCDANTKFNEEAQVCDWDRTSSATANVICPDGLVYNATSDQCDYPEGYVPEVVCDNDATVCQNQTEGALFPIEGVCNKFYKCNFNCAVEQSCPNNLLYDSVKELCDYPQNVDCEWPYTPPSGPTAGPSGISCESNGRCLGEREGVFFPSLTSCSGYIVCQCECEVEMQCSGDLYWDQTLKTCNYANKVNCTL